MTILNAEDTNISQGIRKMFTVNDKYFNIFLFLFSNEMLVFTKILVRIAKREDTDQTAFCLGLFSSQLVFKILELLLLFMKAGIWSFFFSLLILMPFEKR